MSKRRYRLSEWIRVALLMALGWAAPAGALEEGQWDWGFLASRLRDPDGVVRTRLAGPLIEWSRQPAGSNCTALRPFYASEINPVTGWTHRDFLWPIGRYGRLGQDSSWRVLTAFSHHYDRTDPQGRYRLWVLPFYFQGRDAQRRNYWALFPIGGRIHEILNLEETAFVLFPLWGRTSVGEVQTRNILWPIYSRTHGAGEDRFRVFPFYGRSRQENHFDKRFIAWPIFTDVKYFYPNSTGYGYIVFPLWGRVTLSDQKTWMALPPLIRRTRAQQMDLLTIWPFYQRRTGKEERFSIWPFYGNFRMAGRSRSYYLWPLVRRERLDRGDVVLKRFFLIPFYQSMSLQPRETATEPREHRVKIWPLMSYERKGSDRRVRFLSLWPVNNPEQIERSWSDLWTLLDYRSRSDERRTDVLWGLFRRQARGDTWRRTSLFPLVEWEAETRPELRTRSWTLLKGLIAREHSKRGVRYRMLYVIRWGGSSAEVESP